MASALRCGRLWRQPPVRCEPPSGSTRRPASRGAALRTTLLMQPRVSAVEAPVPAAGAAAHHAPREEESRAAGQREGPANR